MNTNMNILIVGSGGREHALAWKAAQSPKVKHVFVAPGNAGTALESNIENIDIAATDIESLIKFVKENNIALTIVGPEAPLADGIVDRFNREGLACFGPTQQAAQLESSKAFSKAFMVKHNIPTAAYAAFTDLQQAKDYIETQPLPIVIKADGLAAGKGVIIATTKEEAFACLEDILDDQRFGDAGSRVVIEEFLHGEEASFIVMADGKHVLAFATSQDHKARDNGDKGPNTGGMGAYSPAPVVTDELYDHIMSKIVQPTVYGMAKDGAPYTGFLYVGVMISPQGEPKVLEYNCRMGDPETQPIMMRLQSDLVELCQAAVDGRLDAISANWDPRPALGVVLCAGGYPDKYNKGDVISSLPEVQSTEQKVFHAGTALQNGQVITNGGRVLCVTTLGKNVTMAQKQAYTLAETIQWNDKYFRTDIGYRAIMREHNIA